MILNYTQQCWSLTLHMFDIELRVSKRIHNYTQLNLMNRTHVRHWTGRDWDDPQLSQPNLLNRTHVWHWTGRDTLDPGGETGHLSPGLWAQHVPPRQLEFKRSEPNVTFQILYVFTLVTLTNPFCCIMQRCCITSSSMSVSGIVRMFFIFLCFCDMHRVATMASCWLVQLFSLDPLFLIFRDVMFQGWD